MPLLLLSAHTGSSGGAKRVLCGAEMIDLLPRRTMMHQLLREEFMSHARLHIEMVGGAAVAGCGA